MGQMNSRSGTRNKRSETESGKGLPEAQEAEAGKMWQGEEQTYSGGRLHCGDGQAMTLRLVLQLPVSHCSDFCLL